MAWPWCWAKVPNAIVQWCVDKTSGGSTKGFHACSFGDKTNSIPKRTADGKDSTPNHSRITKHFNSKAKSGQILGFLENNILKIRHYVKTLFGAVLLTNRVL